MPRYEVHQIYLEGLERYYLPLPKLTSRQLQALEKRLATKGFRVKNDGYTLNAEDRFRRMTILRSGLAWSSGELLDALAPAMPSLLSIPREPVEGNPYFTAKKLNDGFELQLFPRMEGLRIWTELRRSGLSGLTPDEKAAVSEALLDSDQNVECVTDYPTEGCSVLLVGGMQYYRSSVPAGEFASMLRTVSSSSPRSCYLPRSSLIRVRTGSPPGFPTAEGLGEWCFLEFPPKRL